MPYCRVKQSCVRVELVGWKFVPTAAQLPSNSVLLRILQAIGEHPLSSEQRTWGMSGPQQQATNPPRDSRNAGRSGQAPSANGRVGPQQGRGHGPGNAG